MLHAGRGGGGHLSLIFGSELETVRIPVNVRAQSFHKTGLARPLMKTVLLSGTPRTLLSRASQGLFNGQIEWTMSPQARDLQALTGVVLYHLLGPVGGGQQHSACEAEGWT